MGLIQDLQGRKLTGCRGCDAIRKGAYKAADATAPLYKRLGLRPLLSGPQIQVASSHDSFDGSILGAFVESPLGARGDAEGDFFAAEIENDTVDGRWVIRFYEFNDTTSIYGATHDAYIVRSDGTDFQKLDGFVSSSYNSAITVFKPFGNRFKCGYVLGATNGGVTTTTFRELTSSNTSTLPSGTRIEIRTSGGEVINTLSGYSECESETSGDDIFYRQFVDAGCFNYATGISFCTTTSSNTEIVFAWFKEKQSSTPTWGIIPYFGTIATYRFPGFGPCQKIIQGGSTSYFYNGTTLSVSTPWSASNQGSQQFLLCDGTLWPSSASTSYVGVGPPSIGTGATEPLTIDRITNGDVFDFSPGLPPAGTSDLF